MVAKGTNKINTTLTKLKKSRTKQEKGKHKSGGTEESIVSDVPEE